MNLVGVGKERVLRLPRLLNTPLRFRTAAAFGLMGGLVVLSGCNVPSFIDPG